MATYGMVLNLDRCTGCYTYQVACIMVNGTRTGVDYARVERVEWGEYPDARDFDPISGFPSFKEGI